MPVLLYFYQNSRVPINGLLVNDVYRFGKVKKEGIKDE